jgi:D-glycero-D-manno-heptose 1,7-bisphosphate phosphatase
MGGANALRPVVFLDRDGTLNEEVGYIRELDNLRLIAGAAEAVKRLNDAGVAAVLVTNQTGAARGYYDEDHILKLNRRLVDLLAAKGAHLDAVYYCPHLADGTVAPYNCNCVCRKPDTGMVDTALSEHVDLDRLRSYVVGDKSTDVELAKNCGAKGVLVTTGFGQDVLSGKYQWLVKPDFTAPDIMAAVDWILKDLNLAC